MPVADIVGGAVIGAAGVVQGDADAGKAPGLIDANVGDDVGHAEAVAGILGEGGIASTTPLAAKKFGTMASATSARWRPPGSSSDSVAVKPLPNSDSIGPQLLSIDVGVAVDPHVL